MTGHEPDRILLEGLSFYAHVGVLPREKERGQRFRVDLVLEGGRLAAADSDRLEDTVDYAALYDRIRQAVEPARFDLVERLAQVVAEVVLSFSEKVLAVDVTVRKPEAPLPGAFESVGVRLRRYRGEQPDSGRSGS